MKISSAVIGLLLALAAGYELQAQPGAAPSPATATAASAPTSRPLRVDRAKRQVVLQAAISLQEGALEFLVCTQGTRDYEALLTTKAPPSSIHAALLMLGLSPGKSGQWIQPAGEKSVFVPPRGAPLEIAVRWTDAKGVAREVPVTDWLLGNGKPAAPAKWVFVGSDILDDGRYWADIEGHSVSLANFASSVIDVPFQSSDKNAFLEFAVNAKTVPPKGTAVEVIITAVKGAETAPVARVSFSVDALGRIEMDGQPIAPDKIVTAVKQFMIKHAQGAADVRLSERALVYDRERLRALLEEGGMTDVAFRLQQSGEEALPRTSVQAAQALSWWKEQFATAKDLLNDPAQDAEAALKVIQRRRQELEKAGQLWEEYARRLAGLLDEYKKKQKEEGPKEGPRDSPSDRLVPLPRTAPPAATQPADGTARPASLPAADPGFGLP